MQHSLFIEAWLFWLRPYRCLATPFNMLANRWIECALPRAAISRPDPVHGWIEHWWKVAGVVPRALYLEALERKEVLRTRLEEAEATIQRLRETVGVKGQETQANEILNVWESTIQTTLKAQNEWLQTWTDVALKNQQERIR